VVLAIPSRARPGVTKPGGFPSGAASIGIEDGKASRVARIRSVKPELRTSLTAAQWPREVRYFWVLLWGYLDDHGYGVDEPRLIKPDCFPLDDDLSPEIIDKWLDIFVQSGSLCRFAAPDGRQYLHSVNWADHQRPQHPAVPKFPACLRTSHETVVSISGQSHETVMTVNGVNSIGAGQAPSGESHETVGKPPEGLTPEQGAGSREGEQGGGAREARSRATATLLGNSLLDEHRRLVRPPLPRDVARKTGEHIDRLLGDPEVTPDEIREALARLRAKPKLGPGLLANLVHEVRQEKAHPQLASRTSHRRDYSRGGAADPLTDQQYGEGATVI
jgi:hypothetical protein